MFSHAQQFTITNSTLNSIQGHQFNTTVTNQFSVISLGDIFSVFDLARKLVKTLSDSHGSSREYQELILEIDNLSSALEELHSHQTVASSAGGLNLPPSIGNAIGFALSKCRTLMQNFTVRVEGHQSSLKKGGSGSRMRDSWRKMGWAFFKTEELVDLKNRLMEQKVTIITMITMSNSCTLQHVKQIAHQNEQVTRRHDITLRSIQSSIERLPYMLGYTWEGGLSEDRRPLWLIDVLGVKTPLPLELCANWEALDGLLKLYFKNRAGRKYVERGDYDLTGRDNHQLINKVTWDSHVKPGMTINMSIILRLLGLEDKRQCPSCKKVSPNATSSGGEVVCVFCQTSFRVSDSFIEEVKDNQNTEFSHDSIDVSTSKESDPAVEDETRFFRRIHVISTKSRVTSSSIWDFLMPFTPTVEFSGSVSPFSDDRSGYPSLEELELPDGSALSNTINPSRITSWTDPISLASPTPSADPDSPDLFGLSHGDTPRTFGLRSRRSFREEPNYSSHNWFENLKSRK